jgi:uncharacterized membrane protein YccC
VFSAFLIWDLSAWPSGASAMVYAGVVSMLSANAPNVGGFVSSFLGGSLVGIVTGIAVSFSVLPASDSFLWLALLLAALLIPSVGLGTLPKWAGVARGFNFGLLVGIEPQNPQQYDLSASINRGLSMQLGVLIAAFVLFLTRGVANSRAPLAKAIDRFRQVAREASLADCSRTDDAAPWKWETRLYDAMNRVTLSGAGDSHARWCLRRLLAVRAQLRARGCYFEPRMCYVPSSSAGN